MKHLWSLFFLVLSHQVSRAACIPEATAPGDIIIGGLFPIHESVNVTNNPDGTDNRICDRESTARLVQSLIMVHAVEEVNNRQVLGNLTLGYHIRDSCSDVTTAIKNIQVFMRGNCTDEKPSSPPVVAVIGDYHSEISIAVTRQLNLEYIPEISYGATSGYLSDKNRFPSFMRTVPEDDHQARAIVEILARHNWTWIGVVTADGEYGRYAVERLRQHAREHGICIAFTCVLPDVLYDDGLNESINDTVQEIIRNPEAKVIVSFAKPLHMMYLFDSLLKHAGGRNKVWVASDNWSQSADVLSENYTLNDHVGTVIGITLKTGNTSRFQQYLSNLDVNPNRHDNNRFLHAFLMKTWKNDSSGSNNTAIEALKSMVYPYAVFSVELAVEAVAQAVQDLCKDRDCKKTGLTPLEVREALKNSTFHLDGKSYSFDRHHDLNSGYDVILWRQNASSSLDVMYCVANYSIDKHRLIFLSQQTEQDVQRITNGVISRCSTPCRPGYRKKSGDGQPVCCYECVPCPENQYSNTTDSTVCYMCDTNTQYSDTGNSTCSNKTSVFMKWRDKYHILLLTLAALGALLTIIVAFIFLACWNTPVVRSSVGPICIILLLSLLCTFGSVPLFGGKPNKWQCQARQVVFGLSFTLCVSCILVKSFKIILAFEFNPDTKRVLEKLYKPFIIIAVCMAGQVLICVLWLTLKSPQQSWKKLEKKEKRLMVCDEMSLPAFGAMLSYIGFLALICFVVAFKGRKLPGSYNDAKFITFAMLIYFIAWIIFAPVYANATGEYIPAVEMAVILISAYGILFCQFLTKCYIILFKQEANTEKAFLWAVRKYTMRQERDLDGVSDGIQNPALDMESISNSSSSDSLTDQQLSETCSVTPFSHVLNPHPSGFHDDPILNKRPVQRYLSLPPTLPR